MLSLCTFTIVRAVSILDDIDALTGLGSRVLKRFLFVICCIAVISSLFGILFFREKIQSELGGTVRKHILNKDNKEIDLL